MKTRIVFICLCLPLLAVAQMMYPPLMLSDTYSLAMAESVSAADCYAPIDSALLRSSWRYQSALPYFQKELWQHRLSYQNQHKKHRYVAEISRYGKDNFSLSGRYGHRFGDYWQTNIGLHYAHLGHPKSAAVVAENHWLFLPNEHWQAQALIWQLAGWHNKQTWRQAGFHLAGMYSTENLSLRASLDYHERKTLSTHYGMMWRGEKHRLLWGCTLPQARPSAGVAWQLGPSLELASAMVYDWHLGASAHMGISYHYRHE